MKLVNALIIVQILLALNLLIEPVWGQANSGDTLSEFEEGGPPNEPPYVNQEENEFEAPPATPPQQVNKPAPAPKPQTPDIIAAPMNEVPKTSRYTVPKKPTTPEGKLTGHEQIPHPSASQGLLKIEKDGTYIYQTHQFETQNYGVLFRFGQVNPPPRIKGATELITYESMYGSGKPFQGMLDFEWYPFTSFGKLGLQGGVGFFTSKGNGRFTDDNTEAREIYTFYGVPLNLGVVYRLQMSPGWWMAPYVAGGGSYYLLGEKRDDDKPFKAVGVPAVYGAGGLLLNITKMDRETAFTLISEYGIHNLWVSGEFRYVQAMRTDLNVSAAILSLGIVLDY